MSERNCHENSSNNNLENDTNYYPAIPRLNNIINNEINLENQNELLLQLKNQISQINCYNNSYQSPENIEKIKCTIFDELALISSQFIAINEKLKYLLQENSSLKNIIKNKDEIIADYEITLKKSAEKLLQLQNINEQLSYYKMMSNNNLDSYCSNSSMNNKDCKLNKNCSNGCNNDCDNSFNDNCNNNSNIDKNNIYCCDCYKSENHSNYINNSNVVPNNNNYCCDCYKSENIYSCTNTSDINSNNNYYYDIYNNENNKNCDYQENKNKSSNTCCTESSEVYNRYLLQSVSELKIQLNSIENDYNNKIAEKELTISKLNNELKKSYEINNSLNEDMKNDLKLLEKENNELKIEINLLCNEKKVLLNEREKSHNEIISLRDKISHFTNGCNHEANIKEIENKQNEICCKYQNMEKKYIEDTMKLHQAVVKREEEIDTLKEKYNEIIRNLQIEIEGLKNKINNIKYSPEKNCLNL